VWNGTSFALPWTASNGVTVTEISPSGTAPVDVLVYANSGNVLGESLSWSGSEYGFTFQSIQTVMGVPPFRVHFARGNSAGAITGSDVALGDTLKSYGHSVVIWTGSQWAVAYDEFSLMNGSQIHAAKLDASGNLLCDNAVTNSTVGTGFPDIVWNGSEYAVGYNTYDNTTKAFTFRTLFFP
jgi:hypothetical protein